MEMNQVQCVPSWDHLHDDNNIINNYFPLHLTPNPTLQYGVAAELTWQNGLPCSAPKPPRGGTLQSLQLLNNNNHQAAAYFDPIKPSFNNHHLAPPWFDDHPNVGDGVVPVRDQTKIMGDDGTHVGSCSSGATVPVVEESVSTGPLLCRTTTSSSLELESRSSWEDGGSYNSSSSSSSLCGEGNTYTTVVWSQDHQDQDNDNDSFSCKPQDHHHSLSQPPSTVPHLHAHAFAQKESFDEEIITRKKVRKFSVSTKRSRAAAVHSQSERRRREKINQRIKILQRMVPNSTKTRVRAHWQVQADKVSMLDEVIEYMKQLQAQVQMTRMCMSQMMMLQQYINMSMMGLMGVMDLNAIGRAMGMPPAIPVPSGMSPMFPLATFQPMVPPWNGQGDRLSSHDFLSEFLSNQQQPAGYNAYSKLATLYQQFQQPFAPEK